VIIVLLRGRAYCEAKLAPESRSTDAESQLDVTKPIFADDESATLELEDEGARIRATLKKPSATADDLRIVVVPESQRSDSQETSNPVQLAPP
jgi:hypothetical protein